MIEDFIVDSAADRRHRAMHITIFSAWRACLALKQEVAEGTSAMGHLQAEQHAQQVQQAQHAQQAQHTLPEIPVLDQQPTEEARAVTLLDQVTLSHVC